MQWPSQKIIHGGIMHPAKVNYSSDTQKFIKLLIDESKMSMMQRKKVNYHLRNGEPLGNLSSRSTSFNPKTPEVTIRPISASKRRTRQTIVQSGVYEREKFVPMHPKVDREKQKQLLQDKMAFNKDLSRELPRQPETKVATTHQPDLSLNRFDQLCQEIKDREEWLKEMIELGEGDKYKDVIHQQIQSKLRELETLDPYSK